MSTDNTTTYKPDCQLKVGFWLGWKEIFNEIIHSWELIWYLFLRDFKAKYMQSLLGLSWIIINPIVIVVVFLFLNCSRVIYIEKMKVPYPVFALLGLTVWVIFSTGLGACSNSIVSAGNIVIKINFPKISLVIVSMGQALVEFLVRIVLTAFVFVIFGVVPSKMAFLFPFMILPIFCLTLGLGLFLSLTTCLFRDTTHIVTLLTNYLLFLMPIAYPSPKSGIIGAINKWNPLSCIIESCRDIVLYGNIQNISGYIISSLFCMVVLIVSWRLFHLLETKIPERI